MKDKAPIIVLIIVAIGLGVALIVVNNKANDEQAHAASSIVTTHISCGLLTLPSPMLVHCRPSGGGCKTGCAFHSRTNREGATFAVQQ